MFAKIDLSDGFWRMLVRESDKWNFAYVLPGEAEEPLRVGSLCRRTGRAALHTIHGLFPPLTRSGHVNGKDPIS